MSIHVVDTTSGEGVDQIYFQISPLEFPKIRAFRNGPYKGIS